MKKGKIFVDEWIFSSSNVALTKIDFQIDFNRKKNLLLDLC